MVLFKNSDITIYNQYTENKKQLYKRTVIKDVDWKCKRNATVTTGGVNIADSTLIIVDKLDNYVTSREFNKLADRTDYFTFKIGDKIVKGIINSEINQVSELVKDYDNVVTVLAIRELSDHWEIECK